MTAMELRLADAAGFEVVLSAFKAEVVTKADEQPRVFKPRRE